MIHHVRFLVRTITPLLALLLLASAGMFSPAAAQISEGPGGCYQCPAAQPID